VERSEAHSRARRRSCQNTLLATPCIASTEARKSRLFPESLLNLHDNKVSHAYLGTLVQPCILEPNNIAGSHGECHCDVFLEKQSNRRLTATTPVDGSVWRLHHDPV
jgi:hypothetical protein